MSKMSDQTERWQQPFKDLPAKANWIAVDSDGMCYWYGVRPPRVRPLHGEKWWVFSWPECLNEFGYIGRTRVPADWTTAIREVMPEERIGYVKEAP